MMRFLNRFIRPIVVWAARKSVTVDRAAKAAVRLIQRALFAQARLSVTEDRHTVMFFSFMGLKYADSPRAIFEYLLADTRFADWSFIWAFRGKGGDEFARHFADNPRVRIVAYNSRPFFAALASAKYWVTNSHIPEGVTPPKSKVYLQSWHGTPLKRLGADIEAVGTDMPKKSVDYGKWYQLQASKWTHLTSQSPFFTEKISGAFRLGAMRRPPVILETGLPRNSFLHAPVGERRAKAATIAQQLGLPAGKRVALYAPTFRDNQHSSAIGYTYDLGIDLARLRQQIGDDWVVLFRAHYFVANSINFDDHAGFVYDVSSFDDINDLFLVSDVLITDYSSSMVDYANTGNPVLIYAYDLDEYANKLRGFYVSLDEFPGPISTDQAELAAQLGDLGRFGAEWAQRRETFRTKFATWDSAETTARVVDAVFRD